MYNRPDSGILGLGWPGLAENGVVPPVQNLLGQMTEPVFTVFMARLGGNPFRAIGRLLLKQKFQTALICT